SSRETVGTPRRRDSEDLPDPDGPVSSTIRWAGRREPAGISKSPPPPSGADEPGDTRPLSRCRMGRDSHCLSASAVPSLDSVPPVPTRETALIETVNPVADEWTQEYALYVASGRSVLLTEALSTFLTTTVEAGRRPVLLTRPDARISSLATLALGR